MKFTSVNQQSFFQTEAFILAKIIVYAKSFEQVFHAFVVHGYRVVILSNGLNLISRPIQG